MSKLKGKAKAARIEFLRWKLADQDGLLAHYKTLDDLPRLQSVIDSETAIRQQFADELEELSV